MVVLILSISIPAMAASTTLDTGIDYSAEIVKALEDGSPYAIHVGGVFERLRNHKIDVLSLNYEKTYIFQPDKSLEQITKEYEHYLNTPPATPTPAPTPNRVKEPEEDILAKLLYREAGGMGREGKIYVCSAILNLRDATGKSIWTMAHDYNMFSVFNVDGANPDSSIYEVIDYVVNGGRISDIKYFRTDYYHDFGTPVCRIENVYFSK